MNRQEWNFLKHEKKVKEALRRPGPLVVQTELGEGKTVADVVFEAKPQAI